MMKRTKKMMRNSAMHDVKNPPGQIVNREGSGYALPQTLEKNIDEFIQVSEYERGYKAGYAKGRVDGQRDWHIPNSEEGR